MHKSSGFSWTVVDEDYPDKDIENCFEIVEIVLMVDDIAVLRVKFSKKRHGLETECALQKRSESINVTEWRCAQCKCPSPPVILSCPCIECHVVVNEDAVDRLLE